MGLQGYGCSSGSQETTASQRAPRQSLELNHSRTCRQVGAPLDRASTQRLKGYHSAGEVRITPTEGGLEVRDCFADRVQHTSCQDMEHLESMEPTSGSIRWDVQIQLRCTTWSGKVQHRLYRLFFNSWHRMLAAFSSWGAIRDPNTWRRQRLPRKMACQEIETSQLQNR